MLGPIVTISSF